MQNMTEMYNSLAAFMQDGGIFMWFIFYGWCLAMAIAIERSLKLFSYDIDGPSFMNELQKFIIDSDIKGGIKLCSKTKAVLPRVLKNGLKRANQSAEQIQNAIDATALEVIPKIEKRLGYLSLLANISTLLGLLGTIFGLIESFGAIGAVDPSQKALILTQGISKAMNTTALGLIAAIIIMIFHAVLVSKSDKIIAEMDEFSVKLLDLLGTKKISSDQD
jgi:biopolymer transport protein ExbB